MVQVAVPQKNSPQYSKALCTGEKKIKGFMGEASISAECIKLYESIRA